MTKLPNWVDLVLVILILRTCYSGFAKGMWTGLLTLVGAVSVTAITVNYSGIVADWLQQWSRFSPHVTAAVVFWGIFLILVVSVHAALKRINEWIKWERLHWLIQGMGIILGGFRGLWWGGVLLLVFTSSGWSYLQQSVEDRSVLGPRLLKFSRQSLEEVTDRFPGAQYRPSHLIPPLILRAQ